MRILLDTHAFLWWVSDDPLLSPAARDAIANPDNEVCFSAASAWEMAIKASLGRLEVPGDFERFVTDQVARNGFTVLPVALHHALRVHSLPPHHRDPFDRILVAQALVESMPIVTADAGLRRYGPDVIW